MGQNESVARPVVASQHRSRGPHPLPAFLRLAMQIVGGDAARLAAVLAGVRAYQGNSYRRTLADPPAVATHGGCRLLDYGGDGRPVVFVPSFINPPHVLDLAEDNSLLRWLATQGVRPYLIDWGTPTGIGSIDDYVADRLLPLLCGLEEPPALVGYCLGGTMALAAALLAPVRKLALLATPWHFAGTGEDRLRQIAAFWRDVAPIIDTLGVLPMELLQPGFWDLDPAQTVAKYERLALADDSHARAFAALEDWANDGPPLAPGAARQLFEDFYSADLPGRGLWSVAGTPIRLAEVRVPVLNLVSTRDRIVPAATAPELGLRRGVNAGHVGMIVGRKAVDQLWRPLRDWLLAAP